MKRALNIILIMLSFTAVACRYDILSADAADTAFFYSRRLYAPGNYGSANWRIPAIVCLPDGTLLAVNDKRKNNEGDLPQDIDIVCRRSADRGRTWSEPLTIVQGSGVGRGYGDPALVVTADGDVLCLFAGGNGLWASTADSPISTYVCRSSDGGLTWSQPEDITAVLWGAATLGSYHGGFIASGNGLRLTRGDHAGRLLFAAALCRDGQQKLDNFVIYSDDNGHSWHRSALAFSEGDEAKLLERTDGTILMSVRRTGARGYSVSADDGQTWSDQGTWPEMTVNACNGEMLRIDDTTILHSITHSMQRENVSIFISHDEGATWHNPVSLFPGPSVYSSLTLLDDGTIGAFVELNPDGPCELWYMNFNMRWLLEHQSHQ
ncbi:MAG: glycoside hydrolase [Bacteroidales bacterium]|nr:glycoside hydrolase [Bacteroidales bacterium]